MPWSAFVSSALPTKLGNLSLWHTGRSSPTPFSTHSLPFILIYSHPYPYIPLSLPNPSDAEIASGLICVSMPVLPQLIRRLPPVTKATFGTYHRSSSHGSKHFKVPCGGNRYEKRAADGQLAGSDPYNDLHSPRCDYLEMDSHSKSEEKSRDGFTEGGTSVGDFKTGLGLHT